MHIHHLVGASVSLSYLCIIVNSMVFRYNIIFRKFLVCNLSLCVYGYQEITLGCGSKLRKYKGKVIHDVIIYSCLRNNNNEDAEQVG
jgi:hypothetical protein